MNDHNPEVESYLFTTEDWMLLMRKWRQRYFGIDPNATVGWVSEGVGEEFL